MVDTQLFWSKIKDWFAKMADRMSNVMYTDKSKETVDIINVLLIGWIVFALVVYILGNIIATQLKKRKARNLAGPVPVESKEQDPCTEELVTATRSPSIETALPPSKLGLFEHYLAPEPLNVPICSGEDKDYVIWINDVLSWIYNERVVSPVLNSWLTSLNSRTRLVSAEHGMLIDFQSVVPSNKPPVITEAFEQLNSDIEPNVSCLLEVRNLVFNMLVTQVKEKETNVHKYKLNLHRLCGQLNVKCDPSNLVFISQFSEKPQVQFDVEPISEIPPEDYEQLHSLVSEIATDALSSFVIQQNFSSYPECPKYITAQDTTINEDSALQKEQKERLLVKVVKASNLGTSQSSTRPCCVVEMDEPRQRFETTPVEDATCPFWDESFVFILKGTASELLFEIYDKNRPENENFLGLCIVSVEELAKNPSQRQIIPLQSRPLEKDDVSGTLTTEFLFLDREIPAPEVTQLGQAQTKNEAGKVIETNSRVTAGGTVITTTTIKRTTEGEQDTSTKIQNGSAVHDISRKNFLNQMIGDSNLHDFDYVRDVLITPTAENDFLHSDELVAIPCMNGHCDELHETEKNLHVSATQLLSTELKDNDISSSTSTIVDPVQHDAEEITETALKELEKSGKPGSTNKSMLIIHSVQRTGNSAPESLEASPSVQHTLDTQSSHAVSTPSSPSRLRNGVDRSRPKVKKSIIGNLRKKLSFRKPRSRSMEAQDRLNTSPVPGSGNNRSVSSDRMKVFKGAQDSSSLRSDKHRLAVPGSSRSSFSEASGLSAASSRTYINENSTLVVEINENGIIKRYLIPTSMIHRSKWKKKGTKLHLYNDHVFVAKHLSGTTLCHVCKKYLTRRPGKQGYECRDCSLQCHKSCHVKVPDYCPNSSVTSMEVEYIHDPRLAKPKAS